jgi:putative ABC transport system permease protein
VWSSLLAPARHAWWGAAAVAAGLACAALPPIRGLPWAGYAGIALLLVGTIMAMPRLAALVLRRVPSPPQALPSLALAQLQAAPRQAAVSIAAIVASLSLMVAMLIMVHSFRASLDTWLGRMLPADLYLRTAPAGETGFLDAQQQQAIATAPGVAEARFLRSRHIVLDPQRPAVTLLARDMDVRHPEQTLYMQSPAITMPADGPPPIWISEAVHDVYGWRIGEAVSVPLGATTSTFIVAGIWRDYARQTGALVIQRRLYERLTGDALANDAAIWMKSGTDARTLETALRARLGDAGDADINETGAVRARSLAVFDRTFAVTYGLEAAAILVGLLGVSTAFSAQALARRREFGVLRHLGMTRRQVAGMIGAEGAVLTAFGALVGTVLGGMIGLVLIRVINRQSFHWSIDLHLPAASLAGLAIVLVASGTLVAVWSGRYAMRDEAALAVREDW